MKSKQMVAELLEKQRIIFYTIDRGLNQNMLSAAQVIEKIQVAKNINDSITKYINLE